MSGPHPEELTPASASRLRLPWLSRFNGDSLAAHLGEHPHLSLFIAQTGEYVIGEKWRRRDDIACIVEVAARRNKAMLVGALARTMSERGAALVLVAEDVWREDTNLFLSLGFGLIERIVFFERDIPKAWSPAEVGAALPPLEIGRATLGELEALLDVDHRSFPWLWWNSRDEMGSYILSPDVRVLLARREGTPIGYASYTMYDGWAHLDRLAVVEEMQGHGYGAAQLLHVLARMQEAGARRVALSTQEQNSQSHRLYTRFGFRMMREKLGIYGRSLAGANGAPEGGL